MVGVQDDFGIVTGRVTIDSCGGVGHVEILEPLADACQVKTERNEMIECMYTRTSSWVGRMRGMCDLNISKFRIYVGRIRRYLVRYSVDDELVIWMIHPHQITSIATTTE